MQLVTESRLRNFELRATFVLRGSNITLLLDIVITTVICAVLGGVTILVSLSIVPLIATIAVGDGGTITIVIDPAGGRALIAEKEAIYITFFAAAERGVPSVSTIADKDGIKAKPFAIVVQDTLLAIVIERVAARDTY